MFLGKNSERIQTFWAPPRQGEKMSTFRRELVNAVRHHIYLVAINNSSRWLGVNRRWSPLLLIVVVVVACWKEWKVKWFLPCLRSCLKCRSRETGSAVPTRVSPPPFSTPRLNLARIHGSFFSPPGFFSRTLWQQHRQTPLGQSRVSQD